MLKKQTQPTVCVLLRDNILHFNQRREKMNQEKIGKFIAECRKKNNLTQTKLAETLNITDRAISKWETGKSMPDSSIMLALCHELKISVNSNGKVAEKTVAVTVSGVGGINDVMSGVRVYVSATGSTLYIAGADSAQASLFNAAGCHVADIAVAQTASYDMSALATGVYFVRLSQNGTVKTFKVVKRK